ncbi:MAG: flippase activity-associated protein Agl23, partial [bacterium]
MTGLGCPQCGAENPKTNRFCDTCGVKMVSPATEGSKDVRPAPRVAAPVRRRDEAAASVALSADSRTWAIDTKVLWWILIVGVGTFLRLWALGAKPLHHDESIHAWYAYKLFQGQGYLYDPAYHGPFRYHMTALMFFLFGDSDFSCRILPAATGIFGLIFMWNWRGLLGEKGALFAAAMMAISPTWTYDARFLRDDITMAVGCLVVVWGMFTWFETRQKRYLYWATLGFMASFTSHEGTWIFMGILGSYLAIRWLWERAESV